MFKQSGLVPAFKGPGAEEKAELVGNWFKAIVGQDRAQEWCVQRNIGLTRAASEGVGTVGGFLAPEDFDAAIISIRETMGAYRQGADVRPTTSVSQVRPRRFSGLTANFVPEGTPIPESAFELDAVETSQRKLGILARGSSEMFEESAADLGEFLTSEIGYAFATQEDDCGFNGDGTSKYSGIIGLANALAGSPSSITALHNIFNSVSNEDITNLMGAVLAAAIPGAAWYTSAIGYANIMCRLAGSSGALTAVKRPDGTIDATFFGFPVRFSGVLTNTAGVLTTGSPILYFGDMRMSSLIVERRQKTILAISRDRAMDSDQVLVRATQRMDIVNHGVGNATTAAPVAVLLSP